jgi:hypothetical protein
MSRSWLQKAGSVRRSGRVSVRDRGNETTLLDLLNTRRSGQSRTPGYPSRDLSQTASGTVRCDFTASRTPKLLTERLGDTASCPRRRAAPARSRAFRAFIDPQRLQGAHEAMRVGSVHFRTATSICLLANRKRSELAFNRPGRRTARNRVMLSSRGRDAIRPSAWTQVPSLPRRRPMTTR